jgi:hypothetical protein
LDGMTLGYFCLPFLSRSASWFQTRDGRQKRNHFKAVRFGHRPNATQFFPLSLRSLRSLRFNSESARTE